MKKQLLLATMAMGLSFAGFSQTKGTNALSFGINSTTNKATGPNYENKYQYNTFTLGYGYFFKDNEKLGLELTYGLNKYDSTDNIEQQQKSYGGNLSYQHYFPLVKTLFAYAGGRAGYTHSENKNLPENYAQYNSVNNQYNIGAYGGITWFLSKRFALETSLLTADMVYSKSTINETSNSSVITKTENTSFNLTSQGFINNLGFKIYILF